MRYHEIAVLLCVVAAACGPTVETPDDPSSEADSGPPPPPPGELYAACERGGCDVPSDCSECGGAGSCPGHTFCTLGCETVAQCPSPPNDAPVICHVGGCSIDCAEQPCPFDMDCIEFPQPPAPDAHPICMWRNDD